MGWVLFTAQVISGYAEIQATSITNAYGRLKEPPFSGGGHKWF